MTNTPPPPEHVVAALAAFEKEAPDSFRGGPPAKAAPATTAVTAAIAEPVEGKPQAGAGTRGRGVAQARKALFRTAGIGIGALIVVGVIWALFFR